ncbi:MAG: nitrile hydratase subunit beta [Alphaproteobacteria bacterium]|nr:nitrile hydratase subunit beta [Alphaproteobacteria bacterium]
MDQKETPDWAKLSTALRGALGDRGAGLVSLHEGRRAREDMGYERYHALGYFEMGMQAIYDILVQKGVVTEREVQERIAELKAARDNG